MSYPTANVPESVERADASNRAWRTLLQGLGTDVAIAVLPLLFDAVANADTFGSREYWYALGFALAKTAAMTALAYVMRRLKPPPTG